MSDGLYFTFTNSGVVVTLLAKKPLRFPKRSPEYREMEAHKHRNECGTCNATAYDALRNRADFYKEPTMVHGKVAPGFDSDIRQKDPFKPFKPCRRRQYPYPFYYTFLLSNY